MRRLETRVRLLSGDWCGAAIGDPYRPETAPREGQPPSFWARFGFLIADPAATAPLNVVYHGGQVPDIIADNIEIVAEGKLDAAGTFTATNVLAKCPSRLADAEPTERDYQANGN